GQQARNRPLPWGNWLLSSLTVKLVLLVGILVALPILLYRQFEAADQKNRAFVSNALQRQSVLIAQGLRPMLDTPGGLPPDLNSTLARYAGDGTSLKLMLAPSSQAGRDFFYVAAAPDGDPARLDVELQKLNHNGILQQLAPTCADETAAEIRNGLPGARNEMLTSVIPIKSRWGCWVLVSSHPASELFNTAIGEHYWNVRQIRIAVVIYAALTLVGCFIAWSVLRAVRRFRRVAYAIRRGRIYERSFSSQNDIPELAPVAADFDRLVLDLHSTARDIRRKAEDNAHSFKTPLATIRASLSPLRQAAGASDARVSKAIALIDSSVSRLNTLILDAQRVDNFTADSIDTPRDSINLYQVIVRAVTEFREITAARGMRFVLHLADDARVFANEDALEIAIENILDNAVGFSPDNSAIEIRLAATVSEVTLDITDHGPGVPNDVLPLIFDRYFSLRPPAGGRAGYDEAWDGQAGNSGLGLWIVRQNVEAVGGKVFAANRPNQGLRVSIVLPKSDSENS
ncbi:MAG TPA: HAMP domain-containing sensor histidine kinase, partial [Rhizomicrobium sp.]|nr:HAMP domain-containing sensor histidine kinase [Rhizomicrobium sp.]